MIKQRVEDDILIVSLEHGKTNSITLEMLMQLKEIIDNLNQNPMPKGLILTGSGRFFSSGFHLPIFLNFKDQKDVVSFFKVEEEILLSLFTCKKPVVSAINGHAAAGGLIFAMATDYRIAKNHPKIKLGMTEIKIGLSLTVVQAGVMRFGLDTKKKFRDIMCLGEMYDVTKSKELDIIDEIAEEDALIPRAKQIICNFIDTPNRVFMDIKQLWKNESAELIRKELESNTWHDKLNAFFKKDVRDAIAFVQATME
ncbi:MAG: enoyl-CoA hydratase/isomerase family protein [Desulfobacterales bacterium]|nr:enoyl-CoA hydratase/isomerase family protein [Desulfobacterales bacterium]